MIHSHPNSISQRVVLLALLMTAFLTGGARADVMNFTIRDNQGRYIGVTGDPEIAPLFLGSLAGVGVQARLTQSGSRFSITDIDINCLNVSTQDHSCSYLFDVREGEALNFSAGTTHLSLDGSVTTSNPQGATVWAGVDAMGYQNACWGVCELVGVEGGLWPLSTGSFAGTWSGEPRYYGTVSGLFMTLKISGLLSGDSLNMPGSMGVYIEPPPSSSVPEPSSLTLLLGMVGVLGAHRVLLKRRRRMPTAA